MIETNIKTKKQKPMPVFQSEKSVHILIMIWGAYNLKLWVVIICLVNLRKGKAFDMMENHL